MRNRKFLNRILASGMSLFMIASMCPANVFADETPEATKKDLTAVTIGGISYYYADITGDAEDTIYVATVRSRAGSTTYDFEQGVLTPIEDTNLAYTVLEGVTPLTGTLYGYTGGSTVTSYKEIYKTDDSEYDAVSSATNFTSFHAGDISSVVSYGTDESDNKVIKGVCLDKETTEVSANTYVNASIKKAADVELNDDETEALAVNLKQNPTVAPVAGTITPKLQSATYTTSTYGICEFDFAFDTTVEGFTWSEYWDNMYAATVSDGTTTVGAVHWVDLYGEKCTSGFHYNKLQLALNNGTSVGANKAKVTRYAKFFDNDNQLKNGEYTVTLYSKGYTPLEAKVSVNRAAQTITTSKDSYTATYGDQAFALDAKTDGDGALTYSSDNENVASVDASGNVTIKAAGTATITVKAAATTKCLEGAKKVTVTVAKASQTVNANNISKKIKATKLKKKAQSFTIGASATTPVSYKVTKYGKKAKKYVAVSKTGVVKVKKKAKKGTYTVYVTATAAENANYSTASKLIKISVKVK